MTEREHNQEQDTSEADETGAHSAGTFHRDQMDLTQFTTTLVHFYRAEITRSNTWRTRLDATTNWAVVTVGAMLTFAFGSPQNPHFMLLLAFLLVLMFLLFEARRYRYYALWAYRVRLIETDFVAPILAPPFRLSSDWAYHLVDSLAEPVFPISWSEAIGRRLRRNYIWLLSLLLLSWWAKLTVHPKSTVNMTLVVERASIGPLTGAWIASGVGAIYLVLWLLVLISYVYPAWYVSAPRFARWIGKMPASRKGPVVFQPSANEQLVTIISTHGKDISDRILQELGRGVTVLQGTGAYTGEPRDVLLCAVTDVQIPHLQDIVSHIDSQAFFVVSPVQEVRGGDFRPFEPPS
ncbi:MAG TPA: DUF2270 domain-containing protein [Chloroflexi bacterium]|nr:DUF2270 domain-containing protein [Chloroflexota bacterium]